MQRRAPRSASIAPLFTFLPGLLLAALLVGATGLHPAPAGAAPAPRVAAQAVAQPNGGTTPSPDLSVAAPAPDAPPAADDPLQDVVLSAMKTPTTVQQAPATITVLNSERIERQGFQTLGDAVATVPGFLPFRYAYGGASAPVARGILFGTLYLLDGLDMYDPAGFPLLTEWLPVELVQRAEITSGPGGVLWGSNSFVGVGNIVTKSADDVDGLRAHASLGTATAGQRDQLRSYVMGGTKLLGGWLKLFAHAYYRTWVERGMALPVRVIATEGGVVTTERPFVMRSRRTWSHAARCTRSAFVRPGATPRRAAWRLRTTRGSGTSTRSRTSASSRSPLASANPSAIAQRT